jgi:predicted transcriptional regulator
LRTSQLAPERRAETVFIGAHVDYGTRDQLRALAREEERSISAILRRALRHELERAAEGGIDARLASRRLSVKLS